jgi:Flp pilus assembly protein TadG
MVEFLVAGIPLLFLILGIVQLSLLWAGQGAVEAAAQLAARKFARVARADLPTARQAAFLEAFQVCRARPGGNLGTASMTTLDLTRDGSSRVDRAAAGDAVCLRLTHGVELIVPWIGKILYTVAPGRKIRLGDRYYLMLDATRWVTVE